MAAISQSACILMNHWIYIQTNLFFYYENNKFSIVLPLELCALSVVFMHDIRDIIKEKAREEKLCKYIFVFWESRNTLVLCMHLTTVSHKTHRNWSGVQSDAEGHFPQTEHMAENKHTLGVKQVTPLLVGGLSNQKATSLPTNVPTASPPEGFFHLPSFP